MHITQQKAAPRILHDKRIPLVLLFVSLFIMAIYGGQPEPDTFVGFVVGVLGLLGISLFVMGLGWWLLYRPLPDGYATLTTRPLTNVQRQWLGIVLIIAMSLAVMGASWDEMWHTIYGIPFGEDLFWRPHILLYIGLLTPILVAIGIGVMTMRYGKGTIAQRYRADKQAAFAVLMGIFLVYSLPADPVWHLIYGDDISAFSIPHVLLMLSLVSIGSVGASLILTSLPEREWHSILELRLSDFIPIVAFSVSQMGLALTLITTFIIVSLRVGVADSPTAINAVAQYPVWLLPVFAVFAGAFIGNLANHMLRMVGAATLVGIITMLIRTALVLGLNNTNTDILAWLVILPAMVGVDLASAWRMRADKRIQWWHTGGVAAILMAFVGLPLIAWRYNFPSVTLETLPMMIVIPTLIAFFATWLSTSISDELLSGNRATTLATQDTNSGQLTLATVSLYVLIIIFFTWYVATATPPVV